MKCTPRSAGRWGVDIITACLSGLPGVTASQQQPVIPVKFKTGLRPPPRLSTPSQTHTLHKPHLSNTLSLCSVSTNTTHYNMAARQPASQTPGKTYQFKLVLLGTPSCPFLYSDK
ncbi:hypothetical protein BC938DRAFT_472982 [Jimgerdemannia flammicorona]|uniref:Uncharacterized protein n=1 Tax=Jimgerdemannia flammicorona TaxID=994334 RepID=A0A433Q508_9FUNG|nr:hypothetical protein BC938DRAFT_472982 [Jimgerdemannia flammicorona]